MTKCLFIANWYPSRENPLKGVFIKKHAEAIASTGVELIVLHIAYLPSKSIYHKNSYSQKDESGITTIQIIVETRFYKLFHLFMFHQYILLQQALKLLPRNYKPDVIHSHVLYPAGIWGYYLQKKFKVPHIISEHWSKLDKFFKVSYYKHKGKRAYDKANCITAVSDYLKDNIQKFTSSEVLVVPNVVNEDAFKFIPKTPSKDVINFTIVAHWLNPKRPDMVFNSLEKLCSASNKKINLNVVGLGPLLDHLLKQKWNFQLSLKGNINPVQLGELLNKTDYFLHASEIETFSVVIAEALLTGTPVLASKRGAIPELVNDSNGILCENDVSSWFNSLEQLLKINYDHKKIAEDANRFTKEKVGERFKEIYLNLLRS